VILSNEITVTNYSSDPLLDSIKPSKITSLTLKSVQSTNGQIQAILTWKAVGDDLDIGTGKYWKLEIGNIMMEMGMTLYFSDHFPTITFKITIQ